jgi:hypothetical protein
MAEAQLALAQANPASPWLARAVRSAAAIEHRFTDPAGGFRTAAVGRGADARRSPAILARRPAARRRPEPRTR